MTLTTAKKVMSDVIEQIILTVAKGLLFMICIITWLVYVAVAPDIPAPPADMQCGVGYHLRI